MIDQQCTEARQPDWVSPCGDYQLYCGDCLEILPGLPNVDAVVTDPPYGVELTARHTKHTMRKSSTNYQDTPEHIEHNIVPRVNAAVKKSRCALITPGIRNIWKYNEPAELGCVFFPNGAGRSRWGFGTFNPILFYGKDPYMARGLGSRPNGVSATHWNSDDVDHPCPKPVKWMEWMVLRSTTSYGQCILDPFMGSGTTGVACVNLGRKFIGIEINEQYFEIAKNRIKDALGMEVKGKDGLTQKRMFAPIEKTV